MFCVCSVSGFVLFLGVLRSECLLEAVFGSLRCYYCWYYCGLWLVS